MNSYEIFWGEGYLTSNISFDFGAVWIQEFLLTETVLWSLCFFLSFFLFFFLFSVFQCENTYASKHSYFRSVSFPHGFQCSLDVTECGKNSVLFYVNVLSSGIYCCNKIITLSAKLSCAVYCYWSCLWLWCLQRAGGRAVSEPYYSQRTRSVCVSLSVFFSFTTVAVMLMICV